MSKVSDQIAELTKHLYAQHQAAKTPVLVTHSLTLHVPGEVGPGEILIAPSPPPTFSRPLPPGVHPPMGPRFIPGVVEMQTRVRTKAEALAAVERLYSTRDNESFKKEYLGTFPDVDEDGVPSIEAAPEEKKYSRKLEP